MTIRPDEVSLDRLLDAEERTTVAMLISLVCPSKRSLAGEFGVSYQTLRGWSSGTRSLPLRHIEVAKSLVAARLDLLWKVVIALRIKAVADPPLFPSQAAAPIDFGTRFIPRVQNGSDVIKWLAPSRSDLAALAGVNASTLRNWSSGAAVPPRSAIVSLSAACFGIYRGLLSSDWGVSVAMTEALRAMDT